MTANEAQRQSAAQAAGAGKRLVRAIAVGNRINVAAAATEASYCAELERIVGLALQHVVPDRPNLLVLA